MAVNADKPHLWKADIAASVDLYNSWFLRFAPDTYRATRGKTTAQVETAFSMTANLTNITPDILRQHPAVLPILRMATAPPIARDRLIGLAGVSPTLVRSMELNQRIPPRLVGGAAEAGLQRVGSLITRLADKDILPWLEDGRQPDAMEIHRAATIVADRLCGAMADPIIRNAQEQRQLALIKRWLERRSYSQIEPGSRLTLSTMKPGTFAFRFNVPVRQVDRAVAVNIPIDIAVRPRQSTAEALPLLIEAKSAGDFTNTNKRRKEEATKIVQLRHTYGHDVRFVLFLCGYFDSGYLGYEAAEGIDWVWEHRIDDLAELGL